MTTDGQVSADSLESADAVVECRQSRVASRVLARSLPLHRLFVLIAPLVYAAYALVTPPFQTPDEQQHLFRAWQLSEFRLGERQGTEAGGVLPAGLGQAALPEIGTLQPDAQRKLVVRPFREAFGRSTRPELGGRRFFDFRGSVLYSPIGYIPQIFAIWFGHPIGLSVENIVRLGRLFNSALAIFLIYCAIRVSPLGAHPLTWVGLLPMSAAASASFGQDGIVIGGACLLTALGLRGLVNGRWRRPELMAIAGLTTVLTLSKVFYLPLGSLGAWPLASGKLTWRRSLQLLLICGIAAAVTALWLRANSHLIVPRSNDIPPAAARLTLWLQHPTIFLMLLERTYIESAPYMVGTLFKFGWLNVGPVVTAGYCSAIALSLAVFAGDPKADRVHWQTRLWFLLIAASVVMLISAAIYLYSRPASDLLIEGVQARYFIPLTPAVLIALLPKRIHPPAYSSLVVPLMIAANVFALRSIFFAFYS